MHVALQKSGMVLLIIGVRSNATSMDLIKITIKSEYAHGTGNTRVIRLTIVIYLELHASC